MEKTKIDPREAHRTMVLIWFFILLSQVMFFVLLWFIKPDLMRFDLSEPFVTEKNFLQILAATLVSIFSLIISFVRSKRFLDQAIAEQKIHLVQTALIVGCVLSDSITLMGVLLTFALDYQWFFLWFLLGIGSTILHYPSRKNIDAASYKTL